MSELDNAALALSSLASSAVNNYTSYKYSKALAENQLELNKRQFDYQADLQRKYQGFLWQNQGAAQVNSYKQAGLNPAGVNSSIVGGNLPSLSSVGASPSYQSHDPTSSALQALAVSKELDMTQAQTDLLRAQAKMYDTQGDLTQKQVNSFEDTLRSSLDLNETLANLNSERAGRIQFEIDEINQNIRESASRIALNESNIVFNDAKIEEALAYAREADARISYMPKQLQVELMKACALQVQAQAAVESAHAATTSANAAQTSARGSFIRDTAQAQVDRANAKMQDVLTKLKNRYGDAEAIVGMVTSSVSAVGSVMTGVGAIGVARAGAKRAAAVTGSQLPANTTSYSPLPPKAGYKVIKRGDSYEYMRE